MPVKQREIPTKKLGSRHHEKRRGTPYELAGSVRLGWDDEAGKRVSVEAHARGSSLRVHGGAGAVASNWSTGWRSPI